jgi:hypothetical protein
MQYHTSSNTYKLNSTDISIILKALSFYKQHCTFLENREIDFIDSTYQGFKNSKEPGVKSGECVIYNTRCDS